MLSAPINLFAPWDPTAQSDSPDFQTIIDYRASRLRAILIALRPAADTHYWLDQGLIVELVSVCTSAASCDSPHLFHSNLLCPTLAGLRPFASQSISLS